MNDRGPVSRKTRVAICYPLVNPYMAACWQELSQRRDLDVFVIGFESGADDLVAFNREIMRGVSCRLLKVDERTDRRLTGDILADYEPDVLFISGWSELPFRKLYFDARFRGVPKILIMDNQLRGNIRQFLGSIVLKPLLKRVALVFVTGERSWQFARYLGVNERRIRRGCVSVNHRELSQVYDERLRGNAKWPKSFFFAGRYHQRKALDVLVNAYALYRELREDYWPLVTAGTGPEAHYLKDCDGIHDLGFVQPADMKKEWLNAGVFVMPSRFDAWPLVIVEAASTGLPIIATEACGSTVENVRHMYNGRLVPSDDVGRLADALVWMHDNYDLLPVFGERSRQLAAAYSAEAWVERVVDMVETAVVDESVVVS